MSKQERALAVVSEADKKKNVVVPEKTVDLDAERAKITIETNNLFDQLFALENKISGKDPSCEIDMEILGSDVKIG